jgi:branched-subunit amino acid ABC-type transport system permease component
MSGAEIIVLSFVVPLVGGFGLMGGLALGAKFFGPISVRINNTTTVTHAR